MHNSRFGIVSSRFVFKICIIRCTDNHGLCSNATLNISKPQQENCTKSEPSQVTSHGEAPFILYYSNIVYIFQSLIKMHKHGTCVYVILFHVLTNIEAFFMQCVSTCRVQIQNKYIKHRHEWYLPLVYKQYVCQYFSCVRTLHIDDA